MRLFEKSMTLANVATLKKEGIAAMEIFPLSRVRILLPYRFYFPGSAMPRRKV